MTIHTVKAGETLRSISAEYGISPLKLAAANGLMRESLIEGEELLILIPTRTANVRRGERLCDVARRFGVKECSLMGMNPELCGDGSVYDGQPLTVKQEPPLYGLGIGNGYLYRGASKEQLMRAMPYMSYLTVCSAIARRGGAVSIFDGNDAVAAAREAGKLAILRLWVGGDERADEALFKSAAIMAEGGGYHGMALAGIAPHSELVDCAHSVCSELGLKLILDADATCVGEKRLSCDFCNLIYDRIHLEPIPSFEDGEERTFRAYADKQNAARAFIDLSPFALTGGKYVTRTEAREAILRSGGRMRCEGDCLKAVGGRRGREREWVMESLGAVEKKLRLASELGYYGISFDIARTPISELLMFRAMFSEGISMR